MRHDIERFDHWAPTYERHFMQRLVFEPMQQTVLELAAAQVPTPRAILDVGCGTGRLLRSAELRFPGATLIGVDPAPSMVEQAKALLPPGSKIRFQHATAEQLPFAAGEFDLVFSTMTFHHWHVQRQGMAEVKRVLSPQGRWLLADFVAAGLIGLIWPLLRLHRLLDRKRLYAMVDEAGLRVVALRRAPVIGGQVSVAAIGLQTTGRDLT